MTIWKEMLDPERRVRLSDLIGRWLVLDILVVTDTIVSFGPEHDPRNLNEDYFGMSHLMGVLQGIGRVTKAHRGTDPLGAPGVLQHFDFSAHDLSAYDQIWLLGYDTGVLPDHECAAIARFMNQGGGVFATGDHAGLGSALAGQLPRVRSMRAWSSPPPALGPTRVDTTRPDAHDVVVFENQSDDIPQKLRLKWYEWARHTWYRETYPHPLLCSSAGAITEFPDHMHEGEVRVPDKLDAQMTLGGMTFDEYPPGPDGQRVAPEVVAWGWTTGRADPEVMHGIHTGDDQPSNARWSGTIGAYDGHRAGVGRVVVHSTWHHFFDINLIGDNAANRPGFSDPRAPLWRQGFTASANGQRVLAQIDQYYRNIAHWLSPGVGRSARFEAMVASLAMSHLVREVMDTHTGSALTLGAYAWERAVRLFPPCRVIEFTLPPIYEVIPIPRLPWPDPGPQADWPIPPRQMAQAALGGALQAFAQLRSIDELGEHGPRLLRAGVRRGMAELLDGELHQHEAAVAALKRAHQAGGETAGEARTSA